MYCRKALNCTGYEPFYVSGKKDKSGNLPEADSRNAVLGEVRAFLEKSRKEHYYCEDNWYSCPMEPNEGCSDGRKEHKCDCGADKYNAELDIILKKLSEHFS